MRALVAVAIAVAPMGCELAIGFEDPKPLQLDTLAISPGVLEPAFSPEITSYTATVPVTGELELHATSNDAVAAVAIDDQVVTSELSTLDVRPGTRVIHVTLMSPADVTTTYTITARIAGVDFAPAIKTPVPPEPIALALGDFDGNGNHDLAVEVIGGVRVLLGRGDGTFDVNPPPIEGFPVPTALAVGDLDRDSRADVAFMDGSQLAIALGKGDGSFAPPVVRSPFPGDSLAIGEVTGDANLDIVIGGQGADVQILAGDGTGAVSPHATVGGGLGSRNVAVAQLGGSAANDIATLEMTGLRILENAGDGTTFAASSVAFGGLDRFALANFDADDRPDFALVFGAANQVGIHFTPPAGGGPATPDVLLDVAETPRDVAVGDVDGDGRLDLAVLTDADVVVLFNTPTGFAPVRYPHGGPTPHVLVIDDFNGDGTLDLVVTHSGVPPPNGGDVSVLLGVKP